MDTIKELVDEIAPKFGFYGDDFIIIKFPPNFGEAQRITIRLGRRHASFIIPTIYPDLIRYEIENAIFCIREFYLIQKINIL